MQTCEHKNYANMRAQELCEKNSIYTICEHKYLLIVSPGLRTVFVL
jgi:hypothetical protein